MKKLIPLLAFILVSYLIFSFFWNPFPKRLLGDYSGMQEAYNLNIDNENLEVPKTPVSIELINFSKILIRHGQETLNATYIVKDKTKSYYNLDVTIENNEKENWQLYRKGKKIIRPARAPRPEIILLK